MSTIASFLKYTAYNLRVDSLEMTTKAESGHPTSCLSAADIVAVLFFYAMRFDPECIQNLYNDRFILSKGHASPLLYAIWKELGCISKKELMSYRQIDSAIEGHPTFRFEYAEAATGSLGQGLSIAVGMALNSLLNKYDFFTYCLLGDSEIAEGSVWEAIEVAAYYKLNKLIAIVDVNRLGQSTQTIHGWDIEKYEQKFSAFGWLTLSVDGHDIEELMTAFDQARLSNDKPVVILAKTIKGYGVEHAANKPGFHGKAFDQKELSEILASLKERYKKFVKKPSFQWQPVKPENKKLPLSDAVVYTLPQPEFDNGNMLATRKAYGQALAIAGKYVPDLMVLDAEVKNSTYAQTFEKSFPGRFIQAFIAEQNMVGMAVGLAKSNVIPYASTFGAFFTRAFDQIRMAALSKAALRLCGSHAGVSIGQDGPSQMALEDIALFRVIPESIILYPCDAMSTYRCVELTINHHSSISYLRTTRMDTPILYSSVETFNIGGCKVLKYSNDDVACIVAAGITVHESLKAYHALISKNVPITIIDLYSVKPFDKDRIVAQAYNARSKVIVVEDHYEAGGIGEMIKAELSNEPIEIHSLAVHDIPRSGNPGELLAWAGIDARAIEKKVYEVM